MPSISQQDYIYVDVPSFNVNQWSNEVKRLIAKAIDNGVGLDVVLRDKILISGEVTLSRILCAYKSGEGNYYVAFWDYSTDQVNFTEFNLEENNEEA